MSLHSTSPSVYLVLSSVRATNLCGAVGSESTQMITLSFPQNYLYTYAGYVGDLGVPGQEASSDLFNPTDLANCTTSTTTFTDFGPHFADPCSPFIVAPTQLLDIDPAFSTCTVGRPALSRDDTCTATSPLISLSAACGPRIPRPAYSAHSCQVSRPSHSSSSAWPKSNCQSAYSYIWHWSTSFQPPASSASCRSIRPLIEHTITKQPVA